MHVDTRAGGPRERLAALGASALSDAELVSVVLSTGIAGAPVGVVAARLIADCGELARVRELSFDELSSVPGLGASKSARLLAAFELGRRTLGASMVRGVALADSRAVHAALEPSLGSCPTEQFWALTLDARHRLLARHVVACGSVSACPVAPADVFRPVLRDAASGVVFAHNHPSGDPAPSLEDVELTERLCRAADLLGVCVVDHVIIARGAHFSFLDSGLLPRPSAARHSAMP